jgi:TM2 domain-containing membrane protein YozV
MKKRYWVALVLWILGLLGALGLHRFYCGKTRSGIAQCVFGILAILSNASLGFFL